MLDFYLDQNFNDRIARKLVERGLDCLAAHVDGMSHDDDPEVLARSTLLNRVLLTHDDDFLAISSKWIAEARDFAGIVYVPQSRVTIGGAIADLELLGTILSPSDMRNRVEWLPL